MKSLKSRHGFTLIEIMIVIAILGILVTIAIPSLLRFRMNANEGAIKEDLRTFGSANESYRSVQNPQYYADAVASLTTVTPSYLDSTWNNGVRNGFTTSYAANEDSYGMVAEPVSATTAVNTYCIDQTGVMVRDDSGVTGSAAGCSGGLPLTGS